ncbi:LD-carboxypeptidase [Alteromonas sediminis]|uniref:LD-carboxypeptidase n=1 Tax=Alteromonas sediminis TaxID=2259342 RepID=A0A3N5Y4D5_9ALTE|nr:LD-carboxypeptidase [Alteromonas sediminis]RPJ68380.1 LD-carboxypeptidase [Alteromonas sediminis]
MNISRRETLKSLAALSAMTLLPASAVASSGGTLLPKRLVKGMTIGLVAPASNMAENEDIRFAMDVVRSLGFKVKTAPHLFERNQYLAGTDEERANDINTLFADKEVDAIFCLRGGYGTPRILPYIDYDTIAKNPKVLLGYSDITALLNAIYKETGLICYHGPIAGQNFTDYTLSQFKNVLVNPKSSMQIGQPPACEDCREGYVEKKNRLTTFVGGKASGKLIGGNLSLLVTMLGTPYEPDFSGAILFLEDVDESPYRIDRMLTHMWLAGALQKCAGFVLGKFTGAKSSGNSFSVEKVLTDRLTPMGVPTVRGLMIGHVEDQTVVPVGLRAELNADAQTLTLLEPSVS